MTPEQAQQVHRPDPAPSRLKYRLERLMLTPLFRFALRVGLPLAVVAGAAGWYFSYEQHRTAVTDTIAEIRNQIETRPEFMVNLMAIDGASGRRESGPRGCVVPADDTVRHIQCHPSACALS